jgi:hypothetical protein
VRLYSPRFRVRGGDRRRNCLPKMRPPGSPPISCSMTSLSKIRFTVSAIAPANVISRHRVAVALCRVACFGVLALVAFLNDQRNAPTICLAEPNPPAPTICLAEPNPPRPTQSRRLERRLRHSRGLTRRAHPCRYPPADYARDRDKFRNVFVNTGSTC